jgi:hypothetical protein
MYARILQRYVATLMFQPAGHEYRRTHTSRVKVQNPNAPAEEHSACFIVRDHDGQALAYAYFEGC